MCKGANRRKLKNKKKGTKNDTQFTGVKTFFLSTHKSGGGVEQSSKLSVYPRANIFPL